VQLEQVAAVDIQPSAGRALNYENTSVNRVDGRSRDLALSVDAVKTNDGWRTKFDRPQNEIMELLTTSKNVSGISGCC
jgi:hypothetical protein